MLIKEGLLMEEQRPSEPPMATATVEVATTTTTTTTTSSTTASVPLALPLEEAPTSLQGRRGCRAASVSLCTLALLVVGVLLFVVMPGGNDSTSNNEVDNVVPTNNKNPTQNGKDDNNKTPILPIGPPKTFDIPSSTFTNPENVTWVQYGQTVRDDMALQRDIPADNFTAEWDLPGTWGTSGGISGDGTWLVVGTSFRGYVSLYRYDITAMDWQVHSKLNDPTYDPDQNSNNNKQMYQTSLTPFFSGNGQSLIVRHEREDEPDHIYHWDESTDTWIWQDTGLEGNVGSERSGHFAWDYDGQHFVKGSGNFDRTFGGVFSYTRLPDTGRWVQDGSVHGEIPGDRVGINVALSFDGNTLVSSNPFRAQPNIIKGGKIWTWKRLYAGDNWTLINTVEGTMNLENLGFELRLSGDGRVLGTLVKNHQDRVYVYDFVENEGKRAKQREEGTNETGNATDLGSTVTMGTWKKRPSIGIEHDTSVTTCDFCLSADGNLVVFGAGDMAVAFQYSKTTMKWTQVGSFPGPFATSAVSCSQDGRTVLLGYPTKATLGSGPGETAKFTVWKAMEEINQDGI